MNIRREIIHGLDKPRSGWIKRDISAEIAETVLQHVKKVIKAARIYGKVVPGLDGEKLVKMARYHDLAEYVEPDYLPGEISLGEKHKRERAVIAHLRDALGRGQEIYDVWMEFEACESQEAKIAHQLDKLDAGIQALQYKKDGYEKVADFFPWTSSKLTDPLLCKIWDILCYGEFEADIFEQYFLLLKLRGDEKLFKEEMSRRMKGN